MLILTTQSWANNCVADDTTNGVDAKEDSFSVPSSVRRPKAEIIDSSSAAFGLPAEFQPALPLAPGSEGVVKNFILEGNKTGVVRN